MPEDEVEAIGPKGFVIIFPVQEDAPTKKEKVTITELRKSPGSWKVKNLDEATGGELRILHEDREIREADATVNYERRVGNRRVSASSSFNIFQRRGEYALAVDCPSFLSDTTAALLSLCIYGDINGFCTKNFGKEDFQKIWEYALAIGGRPREIHLRRIKGDRVSIYHVTGRDILGVEDIGDPVKLMGMAKKIKRVGFSFPANLIGDSPFHFWVADWGGGTIYEPLQFLPHHAVVLADFFKKALERT